MRQEQEIWTSGSRKTSSARVRMSPGTGIITVNRKTCDDFFAGHKRQKDDILKPLERSGKIKSFDIIARVLGGGVTGQAGALRLGIARALAKVDDQTRRLMRNEGFLTRDARMVERKKSGRPKARKRFQYSKR